MTKRCDFLKLALASYPVLAGSKLLTACSSSTGSDFENDEFPSFATLNIFQGMPIKATFLDEISWDIPHQNWGTREWDADFRAMKKMGINTVVLIRAGHLYNRYCEHFNIKL